MATPKELLLGVLEDLGNEELKIFQWFLQQSDILEDFRAIPKSRLEKADRQDTLDVMVQTYENDAVEVTKMVLSKMKRNDLVQNLSNISSRPRGKSCQKIILSPMQFKTGLRILSNDFNLIENLNPNFYRVFLTSSPSHTKVGT